MIKIFEETTKQPITLIGKMAGVCYGSNTEDDVKNFKRGLDCIKSNHGRTLEFPDVYMEISGYSIKVMREFYTHIGGMPTRLQESTRYVNYKDGFSYRNPEDVFFRFAGKPEFDEFKDKYLNLMDLIDDLYYCFISHGVKPEDASYILPLATDTKVVVKINLRNLIEMSHQRLCSRAFYEYRILMNEIMEKLSAYSVEWKVLIDLTFMPKCEVTGFCTESRSCGRKPKHDE